MWSAVVSQARLSLGAAAEGSGAVLIALIPGATPKWTVSWCDVISFPFGDMGCGKKLEVVVLVLVVLVVVVTLAGGKVLVSTV